MDHKYVKKLQRSKKKTFPKKNSVFIHILKKDEGHGISHKQIAVVHVIQEIMSIKYQGVPN